MFQQQSSLVNNSRLSNNTSKLVPVEITNLNSKTTDADSFYVKDRGGKSFSVRLAGIDAPEIAHSSSKYGQPYGEESANTMRSIIKNSSSGSQLLLRMTGKETYGRAVAEAFVKDKQGNLISLNKELVRQKAAYLYTDPRYLDTNIATPEIKALYDSYVSESAAGKGTGIYLKDAVIPGSFRHSLAEKIGLPAYNALANLGVVPKLATVAGNEGGRAIAAKAGYTNPQLAPFFSEGGTQYLLPTNKGASNFYELAIYNAGRMNAGLDTVNPINLEGYATAAYRLRYAGTHEGMLPNNIPWYVRQFDKESSTPGLGFYINQWGVANGYGRLYKDELGSITSISGAIGAVLDRSFNYYGSNFGQSDYLAEREDVSPNSKYKEPKEGLFQSTFTFASNFALATSTSLLTYFTLGLPYSYATAEIFKLSTQGLLDTALEQGNARGKNKFFQNTATIAALGPQFIGIPVEDYLLDGKTQPGIRSLLKAEANPQTGKIDLYQHLTSLPGLNNLLQRRRGSLLFDSIIQPFISDIINPYSPTINGQVNGDWLKLRKAMESFSKEVASPIYLAIEKGSDRFLVQNIGFERSKSVAKALDEMSLLLPANPLRWSWGHNYSNTKPFVSVGEVFSFSELVNTFEQVYFDNDFGSILSRTESINELEGPGAAVLSKVKSFAGIPKAIIGRGIERLKGSHQLLGPILQEHRKLRKIQTGLIEKGVLQWDDALNTRAIKGEPSDLDSFFSQVMQYRDKMGPTDQEVIGRATHYFEEQKFRINKLKSSTGKFIHDPLRASRGILEVSIAATLGLSMVLDDFFQSTKGASLFSQIAVALNHRDIAAPEFAPGDLLPVAGNQRLLATAAWTGAVLAGGYGIASITQGVGLEKYTFTSETTRALESWAAKNEFKINGKKLTGSALASEMSSLMKERGLPMLKGNFFRNFVFGSFGLLALGKATSLVGAAGLNAIRSTPVIGEFLFGNGQLKPNENFLLVSQLSNFRSEVLRRGNASDEELGAAYEAGIIARSTDIVSKGKYAQNVYVVARQAPLPFIQFFLTSSVKGREYAQDGSMKSRGIMSFQLGLQSAPIQGTNFGLALPVALNLDAKNKLGIGLVWDDSKENAVNYVGALVNAGSTAAIAAAVSLATLEGTAGMIKLLNKEATILQDLNMASNMVKASAKGFGRVAETLVSIPQYLYNVGRGMLEGELDVWGSTSRSFSLTYGKTSPWLKVLKGGLAATVALTVGRFVTDIFSDDERVIAGAGYASATAALAYGYFQPQVHSWVGKKLAHSQVMASLKEGEHRLLSRVNKKWAVPALAFGSAAWLMTDSEFGLTTNMDDSLAQKLGTVGLYTALATPVFVNYSDFGHSPKETLEKYSKFKKAAEQEAKGPLAWISQKHAQYRSMQLRGDVRSYNKLIHEFYHRHGEQLATSFIDDELMQKSLTDIRANLKVEVSNLTESKGLGDSIGYLTERAEFRSYMKGRGPLASRAYRGLIATSIGAGLVGVAVTAIGQLAGGWKQEGVNRFYEKVEGLPIIGGILGDVTRLITGTDRITADKSVDLYQELIRDPSGKKVLRQMGAKLIKSSDPQASRMQNIMQDILAPFAIAPMNTYQSILPGVGINFRKGEDGPNSRVSTYLQIQTAGQDISSSVYSMAPSTLMKAALSGKGELGILVASKIAAITKGAGITPHTSPEQIRLVARAIRGSTGELKALDAKHKRKFSSAASDAETNLIGSSNLLSWSLRERLRRSTELANQPLYSIMARMSDTSDPSMLLGVGNTIDPNNPLAAINRAADGNDRQLIENKSNYLNLLRHIFDPKGHLSIKGFTFNFDRKKQLLQSNEQAIQDTSEWIEYASMYLDTSQMEEPNSLSLAASIFRNFDQAFAAVPFGNVIKAGVYTTGALALSLSLLGTLGSILYRNESAAVLSALETPKHLFNVDKADIGSFKLAQSYTPGVQRLVITKGSTRFSVSLPEEVSGMTLGSALERIQSSVKGATDELIQDVFTTSDQLLWKGLSRKSVVTGLEASYTTLLSSYIERVFTSLEEDVGGRSFASLVSSPLELEAVKAQLKASIQEQVSKMLQEEIAGKLSNGNLEGNLSNRLLKRYRLKDEAEASRYLGYMLFDYTQGLFKEIKQRLLILRPDDIERAHRLEQRLDEVIKSKGGVGYGSQELADAVQSRSTYQNILPEDIAFGEVEGRELIQGARPKGRLGYRQTIMKAFGSLLIASSLFETIDIYGSYARLAGAQDDPNITDAQRRYAAQHAGATTANSLTALGLSYGVTKLPGIFKSAFGTKLGQRLLGSKTKAGLVIGGIIVGVAVFGKTIGETTQKLWNNNAVQGGLGLLGKAYEGASNFIGEGVLGVSEAIHELSGKRIKAGAVTMGLGTALAAVSTLLALSAAITLGASAIAAASTIAIAGTVAGVAGFTLGSIPGFNGFVGKLSGQFIDGLSKIPFLGMFVSPYDSLMGRSSNTYNESGSPIIAATAQQAITQDANRYLLAANDPTGNRTKALMLNPTLMGQNYEDKSPMGKSGLFIRPKSLMNPVLDREIALRSQYHNQSIAGAGVWAKLIRTSDNYQELKQFREAMLKAQPQAQLNHKLIEGQKEQEGKQLTENIAKQATGKGSSADSNGVLASIFQAVISFVELPKAERKQVTLVGKTSLNPLMESKVAGSISSFGKSPVLATQVSSKQTEGSVSLEEDPAKHNDLLVQIMHMVNPTALTQSGFSF